MLRSLFTFPYLTVLALGVFGLSVSACQPNSTDASDIDAEPWSCEEASSPFTYSVCHISADAVADTNVNNGNYALQLFWQKTDNKTRLLTFENVLDTLPSSKNLVFAMNAGMYNEVYAPIGYTVIKGKEIRALNTNKGGGNFHLLPNGVMWWDKAGSVHITESREMKRQLAKGTKPWFATQSGPMLVINNKIHPQFNKNGTSTKFRNGAGVCEDGSIQFVNSNEPVTFYQFAALFKDKLKCPNALFFDGGIASAFYAPSIDKHDKKDMGVIIGVVKRQ